MYEHGCGIGGANAGPQGNVEILHCTGEPHRVQGTGRGRPMTQQPGPASMQWLPAPHSGTAGTRRLGLASRSHVLRFCQPGAG